MSRFVMGRRRNGSLYRQLGSGDEEARARAAAAYTYGVSMDGGGGRSIGVPVAPLILVALIIFVCGMGASLATKALIVDLSTGSGGGMVGGSGSNSSTLDVLHTTTVTEAGGESTLVTATLESANTRATSSVTIRSAEREREDELAVAAVDRGSLVVDRPSSVLIVEGNTLKATRVSDLDFTPRVQGWNAEHAVVGDAQHWATHVLESCPSGVEGSKLKVLIAITSTCCSRGARRKRDAIRQSWVRDGLTEHGNVVGIKFFLSMPPIASDDDSARYRAMLDDEVRATTSGDADASDIVLLGNAAESYVNLTLKTIEMMRYMKLSSCGYTHILKTDDDVYLRVPGLLATLGYPYAQWHVPAETAQTEPMTKVYKGCVESIAGFTPVRDRNSKWYLSSKEWPYDVKKLKYAAGWGYILSADMAEYVLDRMDLYASFAASPSSSSSDGADEGLSSTGGDQTDIVLPRYYAGLLKLEDVMVGYILDEIGVTVDRVPSFKPAWYGCSNYTILKHLDIEAPFMMAILSIQDRSGLWRVRTVQCHSGQWRAGNYEEWRKYSLTHKDERSRLLESEEEPNSSTLTYFVYTMPNDSG